MSEKLHERAQALFRKGLVEGLPSGDQAWLDAHLRECAECAEQTAAMRELLHAFRGVPVEVPRDLAARTQMRIRLRMQELSQSSGSGAVLWAITAASWLLGVFSAPLVWRAFGWFGSELHLPKMVLQMGFVLWWAVPALVAVGAVLHQRAAQTRVAAPHASSRGQHV
jgi:hypothetical protein